jgi:hypothetical protein
LLVVVFFFGTEAVGFAMSDERESGGEIKKKDYMGKRIVGYPQKRIWLMGSCDRGSRPKYTV